jgi:hypothetical protein
MLYASTNNTLGILGEGIRILPFNIGGIMIKKCYKCKKIKKTTEFYKKSSNTTDKLSGRCKKCDNTLKTAWRKNNPRKVKAYEKGRWRHGKKREDDLKRNRKSRLEMSDSYMRELITKKSNLNPEDLTNELIEMCRLNLKLKRVLGLTPKLKSST